MPDPIKCPKCHHEFLAEPRRSSTLRSPVLDVPIALTHDAPICVCEHVRVLHEDDGKGPCTLCGVQACGQFIERP